MLDKLSLTTDRIPDREFMERMGAIIEDVHRTKIYKFLCNVGNMTVMFCPHKFSDGVNSKIAFTKVDLNPKYYPSYNNMLEDLFLLFNDPYMKTSELNVSRYDIASDIEDLNTYFLLSVININKIRCDSFRVIKGTIYYGSNPMGRIYNKDKEIRGSLSKGKQMTAYEKCILDSGKSWVRFEIMRRHPKMSLADLAEKPESLVSLYDSLEFLKMDNNELGILLFQLRHVNRKFKESLKELQDTELLKKIKDRCIENLIEWFKDNDPLWGRTYG